MKSLFEQMGGTYTLQGDYYLPNVTLPAEGNKTIGIWGQRHLQYIRQHRKRQINYSPYYIKKVQLSELITL